MQIYKPNERRVLTYCSVSIFHNWALKSICYKKNFTYVCLLKYSTKKCFFVFLPECNHIFFLLQKKCYKTSIILPRAVSTNSITGHRQGPVGLNIPRGQHFLPLPRPPPTPPAIPAPVTGDEEGMRSSKTETRLTPYGLLCHCNPPYLLWSQVTVVQSNSSQHFILSVHPVFTRKTSRCWRKILLKCCFRGTLRGTAAWLYISHEVLLHLCWSVYVIN